MADRTEIAILLSLFLTMTNCHINHGKKDTVIEAHFIVFKYLDRNTLQDAVEINRMSALRKPGGGR